MCKTIFYFSLYLRTDILKVIEAKVKEHRFEYCEGIDGDGIDEWLHENHVSEFKLSIEQMK